MYTGVFYLRFIKGLWVIAEGAILRDSLGTQCEYDDASRPVSLLTSFAARYILVDYGTTNPCVFLDVYDDGRAFWQEREYYWDSAKMMRQKTDEEYADAVEAFLRDQASRFNVPAIYPTNVWVDPSASSFIACLRMRGVNVRRARNDVLAGIRKMSTMLSEGRMTFDPSCEFTISEFPVYVWDRAAQDKGEDKPMKLHDHGMDESRYLAFSERNTPGVIAKPRGV